MRVFLSNLGCKLNQAEMETLARRLVADGHRIAASLDKADLHIVNSCTVTHVAARTSRKRARRRGRADKPHRTVLTGCYATASQAEAAALEGVDLVVTNAEKDRLLERLYERFPEWRPQEPHALLPIPCVPLEFGNSRALVKIEDGCNMSCSFCIIPATRGPQRSRPPGEIVREVRDLVRGGFREIVLTGVQISSYRSNGYRLFDLTRELLERTRVERLRLTSIAPWDFDLRLLDLLDGGRLCRHFHLSLQSGCDKTLEAMRRPYSASQFAELAERLRRRDPDVALTTDVIVGFPGETERRFDRSCRFVESMGFSRLHAFPYSERPGTAAATLSNVPDASVVRDRMERMLAVAERSAQRYARRQLGSTVEVLWENRKDGSWWGTSDNYLKVRAPGGGRQPRAGELGGAHLLRLEAGALVGEPRPRREPVAARRHEALDRRPGTAVL